VTVEDEKKVGLGAGNNPQGGKVQQNSAVAAEVEDVIRRRKRRLVK